MRLHVSCSAFALLITVGEDSSVRSVVHCRCAGGWSCKPLLSQERLPTPIADLSDDFMLHGPLNNHASSEWPLVAPAWKALLCQ